MKSKLRFLLMLSLMALLAACGPAATPPPPSPTPTPRPGAPQSEADVPRVSPADAKAAFDAGEAIIVDVRSQEAYKIEHVTGAILLPLLDIEANPGGTGLDKAKWIITYCT